MTVHIRQFPLSLEIRDISGPGDGRTVYGRVVPYGEVIPFVDMYDNNTVKHERFRMGALARQVDAWWRVTLAFEHEGGFHNTIGYGQTLQELDDGAYGTFRLYEADAPKAREMLTTSHRGLSLEFLSLREQTASDGVIDRIRVHVARVGAVTEAAYDGAHVLAVRDADLMPTPHLDAVLDELAQLRARYPGGGEQT